MCKDLWESDRDTRKGPLKTNQQGSSHLERNPDLLYDLLDKTTSNYWALEIERLPEPLLAMKTGLRYDKDLENPL